MSARQRAEESAITPPPAKQPAQPLFRRVWLLAVSILIILADQAVKAWVTSTFTPGQTLPMLPPVLHLTYEQNTGAAFGLFRGYLFICIFFSAVVISWILWSALRGNTVAKLLEWGAALILGGAVGNLIDRVRLGYVIDFIDLRVWPVFNIADSAITVGVGLVILHSFLEGRSAAADGS